MATTYRVTVIREGATEDETLFEIAGSANLVQSIVPGVLDVVLSERADAPERSLADRVFDGAVAAGADAETEQDRADEAAGKPKRNRRTKAQIAADKEAVGLGFRDAAHRAAVESAQQAPPAAPAAPTEVPSGYVPPAGEVVVGSVPGPIVTEAPAAPAPGGEAPPWNPFVQPTH